MSIGLSASNLSSKKTSFRFGLIAPVYIPVTDIINSTYIRTTDGLVPNGIGSNIIDEWVLDDNNVWRIVSKSQDFYRDGAKPNTIMTASGTITFSATNFLTWTGRLIVIGGGRGTTAGILSANGYYDISIPPAGTVITTVGGATAITATAAGIPITQWGTLYYKLPSGGNASVPTNFIFVGFTSDYTVASDMVAVATYNQDNATLRMGTGVTLRPNTNSINGSSAIAITAYTSTAVAIADATLPIGTMYTVTVAGAKQLYIK